MASNNAVYQTCLPGFDGGSDETDDFVKWIAAPSLEAAQKACEERGWPGTDLQEIFPSADGIDGIDVVVEEQA